MLRQLEIDDPAHAIGVDEAPIEHDMDRRAVANAGQRVFTVRIGMSRIEQPAAARVGQRRSDRAEHLVGGGLRLRRR